MSKPHPAARAEDAFNGRLAGRLRGRGWQLHVHPYTGYGSSTFARVLGRVVLGKDEQSQDFTFTDRDQDQRGIRNYFTAPVPDVTGIVELGSATAGFTSDRGGYFDVDLHEHGLEVGWSQASISVNDGPVVKAPVQIIGDDVRFGIVSDLDDTAVVTMLPRPMLAAYNSFVRVETARRVVPGMAAMYRSLLAQYRGSPIIYLSTGAWNSFPTLNRFLQRHGYPSGALLLTDWGPTDSSWFRSGQRHKSTQLRRLAEEFPNIQWLLVGDDGQHDPSIYEDFALEHPDNVAAIAIRQLTATQQVLSHGYPMSHVEQAGRTHQVPRLEGPDGFVLHRLVSWSLEKSGLRRLAGPRSGNSGARAT